MIIIWIIKNLFNNLIFLWISNAVNNFSQHHHRLSKELFNYNDFEYFWMDFEFVWAYHGSHDNQDVHSTS